MRLLQSEKDTIEKIRLFSNGLTYEQCKIFFETLITYLTFNFENNKETIIPYLGMIELIYDGDSITEKGREAKVSLKFEPNDNIKKIIGEIVDNEEDNEIEKKLIYEDMKQKMEEIVCTNS